MITGDEKWIVYSNIKRKRSWGSPSSAPKASPKAGLHSKGFAVNMVGLERNCVLSCSNSFLQLQRLIQKSTAIHYTNFGKQFKKSLWNWQIGGELSSTMTIPDLTLLYGPRKN